MATVTVTKVVGTNGTVTTTDIRFLSASMIREMRPATANTASSACLLVVSDANGNREDWTCSDTYAQVKAALDADNAGITVAQLYGVATGTDTYTVTLSTGMSALTVGLPFYVKFGITNTGAATLAVNGLAATAIRKGTGGATALSASDLVVTKIYTLIYDGTNFQINL